MRNIIIEDLRSIPVSDHKVEVVERKGIGHPDTICDSIMDKISVALSKEYLEKFGTVLHYNVDKSLLCAGEAEQMFGGGKIKTPMKLIFGDRATYEFDGVEIPVDEIAINTAKNWFKDHMRFVDPEKNVKYQVEIKSGSTALTDIFSRKGKMLGANDTSAAVGYAPLTETEKLVLNTEKFLNGKDFKRTFPETGEDVKVMGSRHNGEIELTVAMPLIDRHVNSVADYFRKKQEVVEEIEKFARESTTCGTSVYFNALDRPERGINGCYLTVTGTCAEDADSGQVGRGNRVNGIIPLNRFAGGEAGPGKNSVSHVGKIYNLLSHRIANEIYEQFPCKIDEAYVWLQSRIGQPIDQPAIAAAQLIMHSCSVNDVKKDVSDIMERELSRKSLARFCSELAEGKYSLC